jgi:mannose/fructose/N-acetylgalactosamine-specific phosphotransferase system component IIC
MQITVRPAEILSRVAALVLMAIPLAALMQWITEVEREEVAQMSHQQLKEYLAKGHELGFTDNYLWATIMTAVYIFLVEAVAFVIRQFVRMLRPVDEMPSQPS